MIEQSELVAGHRFTLNRDAICECGIAWPYLREFGTRDKHDRDGYAHHGKLTSNELDQIERCREREKAEDERVYAAIAEVAKP